MKNPRWPPWSLPKTKYYHNSLTIEARKVILVSKSMFSWSRNPVKCLSCAINDYLLVKNKIAAKMVANILNKGYRNLNSIIHHFIMQLVK
jgi:hypothetical protein